MSVPLTLSDVPNSTPYIQYVATNGQTVFPYPFPITQDSDLIVVDNGVTLATDSGYTLSGQGTDTGGNVTFAVGRSAGDIITLYRDIPIERISQIAQNSGFSSTTFNAEFNNIYLLLQQLQASIDQCLQIPNTNNPAPTTTLNSTSYANKYLAFDAHGNPEPADLTSAGTLTQSIIGGLLYPQTAAETAAGVTPVNYFYTPGDIRRYGAKCDGVTVDTLAITDALACNQEVFVTGTTVATGLVMGTDGQRLYGIGRGATIKTSTSSPTAPCVKVTGNRQIVENLLFDGGSTTDDTNTNFVAVQITGTRALVKGVATSGVWVYAIDLQNALYSHIAYCNIDGFRKRGVNINSGGQNSVVDNMVFDSSLTAPTDAHIYVSNSPVTWIYRNYITRSVSGPGIYATAALPNNMGLSIVDNNIDNGNNWAIQISGWWDVHIKDNWLAWGQGALSTGQISLTNCKKFYVCNNDVYSSLNTGWGIYATGCAVGVIDGNTIEYNYTGIQIDSAAAGANILVRGNVTGQFTGLPPTGVPTHYSYVESACVAGCEVFWQGNLSYQAQTADYSGITYSVVADAGYDNQGYNVQAANYTAVIADRNGTIVMNAGVASTLTLPANVFKAGDRLKIIAGQGGKVCTIQGDGTSTLYWANGTSTSGARSLTGIGEADVLWESPTVAIISGSGLT